MNVETNPRGQGGMNPFVITRFIYFRKKKSEEFGHLAIDPGLKAVHVYLNLCHLSSNSCCLSPNKRSIFFCWLCKKEALIEYIVTEELSSLGYEFFNPQNVFYLSKDLITRATCC